MLPAWSNKNLFEISNVFFFFIQRLNFETMIQKVKSELFVAHIRAAMPMTNISESNCHPFSFGRFL